jgi:hypothetical protein
MKILLPGNNIMSAKVEFAMRIEALVILNCRIRQSLLHAASVYPSAWSNSTPTGRIFITSDILVFFEVLSRKFKFHYNVTRIKYFTRRTIYIFYHI